MHTISSHNRQLHISQPIVMGILNATPNSFYNQGRDSDLDGMLGNAEKMLREGATILDVGGASTRPGEPLMAAEEELKRIVPIVEGIRSRFPEAWISIDTYNSAVAKGAVAAGADIVNDISAGAFDPQMLATVASLRVPYIAMHIQGIPETMQQNPQYDNVVSEVKRHLTQKLRECTEAGIKDVIIDPGFGFGKTVQHNFALLGMLRSFSTLGQPILAGLSRKSMICRPLKVNPEHALNGTTALNMIALQNGANILRVHDVKEAMETITLHSYLQ